MRTLLLIVVLVGTVVLPASAQPYRFDHEPGERPLQDLTPSPWSLPSAAPDGGEASLAIKLELVRRPDRMAYGGGLVLTLPTRLFVPSPKAKQRPAASKNDEDEAAAAEQASSEQEPAPTPNPASVPRIRAKDAQAAVAATLRHAGAATNRQRLEAMASRARWSALLPRVRLRATRLIDESSSLSPTSYDANRTTASGGASLWLEARSSWNLDRLVFANEETKIERLRNEQRRWAERRSQQVLALLFDWQLAIYTMHSPMSGHLQCMQSWLRAQQLAAALTVTTGGWFKRWRRKQAGQLGSEPPDCDAQTDLPGP